VTAARWFGAQGRRATAVRGSLESSRHNALQAAMKLFINSPYGYMGASAMALFANRAAADEVTQRGML
jgi:DNA polymerase I